MAIIQNTTGVKIRTSLQALREIREALQVLGNAEVLVGFPEDTTNRPFDPTVDEPGKAKPTNATLGYIHDQGSPDQGIPQREFMRPAVDAMEGEIDKGLSGAMKAALRGNVLRVEQAMHALGMRAQLAIQNKIDEGIPPPLSDYTIRKRIAKGQAWAKVELGRRQRGLAPSLTAVKPLIDTGEMRKSVKYVIRQRSKRRT